MCVIPMYLIWPGGVLGEGERGVGDGFGWHAPGFREIEVG